MAGRKQRDNYGRYRGKAGIKPYKSNLPKLGSNRPRYVPKGSGKHNATSGYKPGRYRSPAKKKSNTKRNIAIGVGAAMTVGAVGYMAYRSKKNGSSTPTASPVSRPVMRGAMGMRRANISTRGRSLNLPVGAMAKRMGSAGLGKVGMATLAIAAASGGTVSGNNVPLGKAARNGISGFSPAPVARPVNAKPMPAINAASLVAKAGTAAKAAKASTKVSPEDRKDHEDSGKRWAKIEEARKKGIPAAADFVDNGGDVDNWRPSAVAKPAAVENANPTDNKSAAPVAAFKSNLSFANGPNGRFVKVNDPYDYTNRKDRTARNKKWQNSNVKSKRTTGYSPDSPGAKDDFDRSTFEPKVADVKKEAPKKRASAASRAPSPKVVENAKPVSIMPKPVAAKKVAPVKAPAVLKGKPAKSAKVKDGKVDDSVVVPVVKKSKRSAAGTDDFNAAPPKKTVDPVAGQQLKKPIIQNGKIEAKDLGAMQDHWDEIGRQRMLAGSDYTTSKKFVDTIKAKDLMEMEEAGYDLNREQRTLVRKYYP